MNRHQHFTSNILFRVQYRWPPAGPTPKSISSITITTIQSDYDNYCVFEVIHPDLNMYIAYIGTFKKASYSIRMKCRIRKQTSQNESVFGFTLKYSPAKTISILIGPISYLLTARHVDRLLTCSHAVSATKVSFLLLQAHDPEWPHSKS